MNLATAETRDLKAWTSPPVSKFEFMFKETVKAKKRRKEVSA